MPRGGAPLRPAELAAVADWIRAGAPGNSGAAGHWAFRAPRATALPVVRAQAQVRNPIDAFLLADLERRGLSFSPEADRITLLRRVTFDLVGVPPTPEECDAFLRDAQPLAYERVVDRLLADPRYGERWARHWLDAAGYAESEGVLQEDRVRPNAWRYRDYVIRSLNADKPYDQFLREQIAGDEIADYKNLREWTPEQVDQVAATGFLRNAVDATRDDFNPHQYGEYQYRMLHDTETILATSVMGLQLQCARCHNHKYEPLSQKDYYRVQALLFAGVRPRGTLLPTARRQIVAASAAEQERVKQINAAVDAAVSPLNARQASLVQEFRVRRLEARLPEVPEADREALLTAARLEEAKRSAEQRALVARFRVQAQATDDELIAQFPEFREQRATVLKAKEEQERKRINLPTLRAFYDQDATPPPTPLLIRGDWLRPGEPVEPGIPAALDDPTRPFRIPPPPPGAYTTGRRRALADWLTRPEHPLTARVLVNRVWYHHFGVGIVPTLDNFGRSGAPPTNQPLLDWLAVALAASSHRHPTPDTPHPTSEYSSARPRTKTGSVTLNRSLKALHRLIVTSTTYRQASHWRSDAGAVDPDNQLLWRQRARRLEAEAVRDAVLSVSGMLDSRMFGEPTELETRPTGEIAAAGEAGSGRRSIYVRVRRTTPVTFLNAFDQPVIETNCTRRTPAATATQALAQMNSAFLTTQARHFARRLLHDVPDAMAGTDPAAVRLGRAYRLAFGRTPSPAERTAAAGFLREQMTRYAGLGKTETAAEDAWADLCQALLSANEFLYLD